MKDNQIHKSALSKKTASLNSLGMAYEGLPCLESLNMEKKHTFMMQLVYISQSIRFSYVWRGPWWVKSHFSAARSLKESFIKSRFQKTIRNYEREQMHVYNQKATFIHQLPINGAPVAESCLLEKRHSEASEWNVCGNKRSHRLFPPKLPIHVIRE